MASSAAAFWAVVPAAGVGARMQAGIPKQYLPLAGATILEHSLHALAASPRIRGIVVALSAGDPYWAGVRLPAHLPVHLAEGGAQRAHSVLNALSTLASLAEPEDFVLVHDAARPCLSRADLDKLIDTLERDPVGGLLAVPVRDTLKRATGDGRVEITVERQGLWHALTPQMFRLGKLSAALAAAQEQGRQITDEAQAMESAGYAPRLIEGSAQNIKITYPHDLELAEAYFSRRSRHD